MKSKQPLVFLSSFHDHVDFLFYVLVIFLTFTAISASSNDGNETDHQALLKIKSMISTPGALTSWNNSLHFCDWIGVTCGKRHRRVTRLVLKSQGLEGSLSPHVGNLSFLHELSLGNNSFQGAIPQEVGRLYRLRVLYLYQNKFNGAIPANISSCTNLKAIGLSENKLAGSVPKEISFLTKLTFLSLYDNNLTGGIPPSLGNITSMEVFSIPGNSLGGSIPDTLGKWKSLKEIYLGSCNLSGTIPLSLYNLSLLSDFSLAENQLTGNLHPAIGELLPRLAFLQLYGNHLTGPIPSSISNCSRLIYLEMSENNFNQKLTIDFAKLKHIRIIRLFENNFGSTEADEMKFIDTLKNCTKLEELHLGECKFQGVLPASIGNLSNRLQLLYLENNQLHGNLPKSIGNLVGMELLSLGGNQFTGNIPSTIGNLQKLQVISLYSNKLSGKIPDAIGNLSSLLSVYLDNNMLEGDIPLNLGNCHRLTELHLDDNKLNGKIPTQLLKLSSLSKDLDLSQNNLFGSLPAEVGHLNMLSTLDLSDNNLSGSIPSSLRGCVSLSRLSLKGNKFQGMVPLSLISLKGMVELDISQNYLSGQFPQFLEKLKLLEYLNLSYNDFEGEVPILGVFANASRFTILGNSRLCGGIMELGLPKCKEIKKHKKQFPRFVIGILVATTLFSVTSLMCAWCKKKRKSQMLQSSTSERHMKISYGQLLKATNGFSNANLIGIGGFGSVYKGILDGDVDRFIAVKVLHLHNQEAQRSFMRECEAWRNIRHRNILRIITACSSIDFQGNEFKALVYEFMSKGSLHDWLHSTNSTLRLNLVQIINILMDVASALDYLHNQCIPTVVHGDLKPSNILLDDDMVAHVGDFGLARLLGTSYSNNSPGIRGTIGYVAPEYGLRNEMTSSGDVYSFGILLLEMITGKTPTEDMFNESLSLHKFASKALPNHVMDIIDVNILNVYQGDETFMQNKEQNVKNIEDCLASTVKIGVSCTVDSPPERMDMKNVVYELHTSLVKLKCI